jgi:hypothetical protein
LGACRRLLDGTETPNGFVPDYEEPDPEPAPFSTIAWRLAHITMINRVWADWLFGDRQVMFWDIEIQGAADRAVQAWEEGFEAFERAFADLLPQAYEELLPRYDGAEPRPVWATVWSMVSENEHHGAEIGCVRDLYFHCSRSASDVQLGAGAVESAP